MIEVIKAIVADKETLLKELLRHVQASDKAMRGLEKAAPTVLSNESEANTRKMLNVTMNDLRRQQELNQILIAVVVMLCSSRDFTGWQAELAMKLGADPSAVLRQMFNDKMNGKS